MVLIKVQVWGCWESWKRKDKHWANVLSKAWKDAKDEKDRKDRMRRKAQCKEKGKFRMSEIGCLKRVCV